MMKWLTYQRMPYIKAYMHVLALMPLVYLGLVIYYDELGGDPVQAVIHFLGKGALNLLLITLMVSPIVKQFKLGLLMSTRRLLGLYCFLYTCLHLLAFAWLDLNLDIELLLQELIKRSYILLGLVSFVILLLMAVTSPNIIRRKMRKSWQTLHNFIYLVAVLTPLHYYLSVKSGWVEPVIYFLIAGYLLSRRIK